MYDIRDDASHDSSFSFDTMNLSSPRSRYSNNSNWQVPSQLAITLNRQEPSQQAIAINVERIVEERLLRIEDK